jgi:hypothetical protein
MKLFNIALLPSRVTPVRAADLYERGSQGSGDRRGQQVRAAGGGRLIEDDQLR